MEVFKRITAFRGKDLKRTYGNYYTVLLDRMIKKGIIKKIIRGWYTFHEDPIIFSWKPFFPCYYSLEFALSFYGYYEQFTNIQIVTTRKYGRKEVIFSDGTKVFLFKISKKLFFGYDFINYERFKIPIATKEKLLIDLIYFKREVPEYVKISLIKDIDMKKLINLLKRIKSKRLRKRVINELARFLKKDWFEKYAKEHLT